MTGNYEDFSLAFRKTTILKRPVSSYCNKIKYYYVVN